MPLAARSRNQVPSERSGDAAFILSAVVLYLPKTAVSVPVLTAFFLKTAVSKLGDSCLS
jgi:hypothetical protein